MIKVIQVESVVGSFNDHFKSLERSCSPLELESAANEFAN